MARGRLIVFEGVEGAGKSTQLARLVAHWQSAGQLVHAHREPGGTAVGERARATVLDPALTVAPRAEALLFLASRAQLLHERVRPALARGETVCLDRFFLSTYAYQIHGRGLPDDALRAANAFATDGIVPDCTVLLTLPGAEGLRRAAVRGASDRMEQADAAFHARVDAAFRSFAAPEWQAAHPECGPITAVDAVGSADEVFARVHAAVRAQCPELA
ncbi:MAG: dTMP kinase [Gemmatimonadaceae bacterium]|nr:dTMP kinase [Gemmatimonadaceae bacterium]